MQPSAPTPPPANGQDPYGFIMSSGMPTNNKGPSKPTSVKSRLIVAVIAGIILVMIGGAVFSLILNSGPNISENLTQVAYKQAEIIRVANIGTQKGRSSSTVNFAYTTKLSVTSDEIATLAYFKTQGGKLTAEKLEARKNAQNDATLAKAEQTGAFDDTVVALLKKELSEYQKTLKSTYEIIPDAKGKKTMTDGYNHVTALLKTN